MKKVLYIFGQLDDKDVEWLINNGDNEKIGPGKILIKKGNQVKYIYIALDGKFSVLTGENEDKKIAELLCGDFIGEMSFVDSTPPNATVRSEMNSSVYSILKTKLENKIKEDQGFGHRFYKAISIFLADRLRTMTALLNGIKEEDMDEEINLENNMMFFENVSAAGDRFHRMLTRMQNK
ncbi:MAG TPA: cyclic nucleotide-binding domain-containing protein [Spirochaetota bacterium]|nr:cyclic nucleotide-binding domain-containing protein [Spirochaetota bacterium]HOS32925.1 cyclic nucleotide-binding domain-containing protein [Spirochaetota bacterium]HOS55515.1 cyclic nucleotide-binding domain-containing protein [Spirochaetota bacterium]HPK61571.1 cyclic nucleotide-binding domain-containing protein [Spirochaetota bacterium]HQF78112.1 cyclic nucleotide-binding domain-containing protein [Spirochaetota bacterium]